ncbi:SMAP1 protein, partial [Polypterus senegalus]
MTDGKNEAKKGQLKTPKTPLGRFDDSSQDSAEKEPLKRTVTADGQNERERKRKREMTTRSEREKAQKLNEQHQAILSKMLREEDNKYCADCEAKDAPAGAAITNGNNSTANSALNDDLDIFGPMVSNPLPSSTAPFTQVGNPENRRPDLTTGSMCDLIQLLQSTMKVHFSLEATAGMFMGPPQIPFASQPSANFQAFPSMGTQMPPAAMMGPVMGQSMPMMAQNTGMMVNMAMPNGYMGNAQAGVIGLAQNVMGPQAAMPGNAVNPQNMYTMQANQQGQWNMSQMNHQMTAMNLNGPAGMMGFNQSTNTMGAWTGSNTGQTLSTQLWK